jgi:hypothetical protein
LFNGLRECYLGGFGNRSNSLWRKEIAGAARSLGKAQSEYEKARIEAKQELDRLSDEQKYGDSDRSNSGIDRRQKLEEVALKLKIDNTASMSNIELQNEILKHIKNVR